MRTTFKLDDDVAAEVERLRREQNIGISEAVNRLIRAGMARPVRRRGYQHRVTPLGLKVDVTDVAGVLELLDEA